jgi:6-phosphogluconolactonase
MRLAIDPARTRRLGVALAVVSGGALATLGTGAAQAAPCQQGHRAAAGGAVYVATNHNNTSDRSRPANQVVEYRRGRDGRLKLRGRYDTGGQGSGPGQRFAGDGLGAGNSVWLSEDRRFLLVANAGSDSVSVFRIRRHGLKLTDVQRAGDGSRDHRFTNSVAQHGSTVYALNSGDDGSITGFRLSPAGKLTPLDGSTRGLEANQTRYAPDALANPTQVSFTPDGSQLVVTIKDGPGAGLVPGFSPNGPGRVLVFNVDGAGRPSDEFVRTDFDHRGPFGFSFDARGNLLVAQFVGGAMETVEGKPAKTAAAGSYAINDDGTLTPITVAEGNHQVDSCWLVNNGTYAYTSNYTSGTISSFRIGADGGLTLLEAKAGIESDPGNEQGSTPLDLRTSPDGRFLYNVEPGAGKVGGWRIEADGSLTKLGEWGGLDKTVDGDHAPKDFSALASPAGIEVR